MREILRWLTGIGVVVIAGCVSPQVNPKVARGDTGYVDFYTDSDMELSWWVEREGESDQKMRTVFSEFKPIAGNILRLATPAGKHRFEVWFSNQVTTGPQAVIVEVANGKVTPVHVTLTSAGASSVQSQTFEYRPTPRATRRMTRTTATPQSAFHIGAVAQTPRDYQPKERMPYFKD